VGNGNCKTMSRRIKFLQLSNDNVRTLSFENSRTGASFNVTRKSCCHILST
jgi:hypothetical protein